MITIRSTVEAAGEGFAVLAYGSGTDVENQTPHLLLTVCVKAFLILSSDGFPALH